MIQRHEISLPIVFDGEVCSECGRLFHASFGWFCTAFDQCVEKTPDGKDFDRCPQCKFEFPSDPDREPKQNSLF